MNDKAFNKRQEKLLIKARELPITEESRNDWAAGFLPQSRKLYGFDDGTRHRYLSDLQREMTFRIGVGKANVLNDKIRFAAEAEGVLNVPRTLGILADQFVGSDWESHHEPFIVKPATGGGGVGIFRARVSKGHVHRADDKRPLSEFKDELVATGRTYIFQALIKQHSFLQTIYPGTVNTLRVLMARDSAGPFIACCVLRCGSIESAEVDNFSRGGTSFAVDLETGIIGSGRRKDFSTWKHHPDTGVVVTGQVLPFWSEVKKLCFDAMAHFTRLEYVGWDVVIADDGAVLLEGNSVSDVNLLQVHRPLLDNDRLRTFYKAKGILDVIPTVPL